MRGKIVEDFYDPEIISSPYVARVMHNFFNEERKNPDFQKCITNETDAWKGSSIVLLVGDGETVMGIGSEMLKELGFIGADGNGWRTIERNGV